MHAVPLAARKHADLLLLVGALEVEGADIGARLHLVLADAHHVVAARDFLPDILVRVERVATLVDIAEPPRVADRDPAAVGLFLARYQAEQGRIAGAVRADAADEEIGRTSRWGRVCLNV